MLRKSSLTSLKPGLVEMLAPGTMGMRFCEFMMICALYAMAHIRREHIV